MISEYHVSTQMKNWHSQFWRQGYLVLEDFFDAHLMDRYQRLILEHFGEHQQFLHDDTFLQKAQTEVIPWFPQRQGCTPFNQVEQDRRLRLLTQSLLGAGWQSHYSMVMFSKPGSKGQAWHQDCPPEDPSVFNLNRLVYTMDINAHTGGQVVIRPGTHLQGELTMGALHEDFADQVVLTPHKGTLVLLHGHTWHRITPIGEHFRVSTNYRCAPLGVPEDITDICVYRNMRYQFSSRKVLVDRTDSSTTALRDAQCR